MNQVQKICMEVEKRFYWALHLLIIPGADILVNPQLLLHLLIILQGQLLGGQSCLRGGGLQPLVADVLTA